MSKETAVYTHGHHESVLRSHRWRTATNSAAYLIGELHPGLDLLDVGCGPGTITADLAELVAPGRVTAVDAAEDVLRQAGETAVERGLDHVRFAVADVHALDFPDDSFDVVHAHQVLQHVGDPVQALREMRRVCRPGGIVAARDSDYGAFTWFPEVPALDGWQSLYQRVARANGASRTPVAGCCPGPAPRASATSPPPPPHGVSPHPRSVPGGADCGRTARPLRCTRSSRWTAAMPVRSSWPRSPTRGASGAARTTPGSWSRTAKCSAGRDVRRE